MSHELLSSTSARPVRVADHHRIDLARAQTLVVTADLTPDPATRYLAAHHALRELAVLALRARTGRPPRGSSNAGLWRVVAHHAPELAEWAGYLSAIQPRHDAAARGELPIGDREADDLVRDAQTFLEAVGRLRLDPGGRR
ncbi:SAV_6107 family HEPN domain-containing protein [Aestuariimicrobium kwangyangense]|uniref:SAV_6107 family HEPN domain-containing protein n=1 Tax=Aestuariimicrobium kwangyangense TaxID=396389 RepID=UPI0003B72666|nr:SAV_6107 family HEPN domain-containing protein [Aestuariimicrobium kwangyangense]